MRIIVSGKNITVSNALRERVESKLSKFDRYFGPDTEAKATMSVEKERQIIEVTILIGSGTILRSEAATDNMYGSIDEMVEKLEKQIHKQKSRLEKKMKEASIRFEPYETSTKFDDMEEEIKILKRKKFAVKPMNSEEAVLQMELLGHSFYVFLNGETDEVNVVYRRKNGNYGLIEPEF